MIKQAKNVGHDLLMDHREKMWIKVLKFTLCSKLKENFYKIMY